MKQLLIITVALLLGYYLGGHEIYMAADVSADGTETAFYPHAYSIRESLSFERQYANALMEGLHRFYSNDDNDLWFDVFMQTPEYHKIDSLNGGDWEDFYHYETDILSYETY